MSEIRQRFSTRLSGDGIDIGPGHCPWPVPPTVRSVRLVDRWDPDANRTLFPELGADADFREPDVISNLDVDRLSAFGDRSLDFVIASHVLEHLADPIGCLGEIRRVLRRGGVCLVMLPDRRYTFDRGRPGTPLAHLVAEHRAGVTEVDDEHVLEFIRNDRGQRWEPHPAEVAELCDIHRRRSVHAHCWTYEEFGEVIGYASGRLGRWRIVDEGHSGDEFGFVLRRRL